MKTRPGKKVGAKGRRRVRRGSRPALSTVRAVFLVGFMGAGKTSVGRTLAQQLNWTFEDLDDRIETRERRTVEEIFRDSGESVFRKAEHAALRQALEEMQGGVARIVALGGGAFAQPENQALLKTAGVATVFLDAPVDELWQRCCAQASEATRQRPLLKNLEQFRSLYVARRQSYSMARLKIDTEGRSVQAIASQIAEELGFAKVAVRTEQGEVE